jgi:hypothetical protein
LQVGKIVYHPVIPHEWIVRVAYQNTVPKQVVEAALTHPDATLKNCQILCESLAHRTASPALKFLLCLRTMDGYFIQRGARKDSNWWQRVGVALNPNTKPYYLKRLSQDGNSVVRAAVRAREATPNIAERFL